MEISIAIAFMMIISIAIIAYSIIRLLEQYKIKKNRIDTLNKLKSVNPTNLGVYESISELYIKSFSHYFTYVFGHFSGLLLDIYSIMLSVTSLSMISLNTATDKCFTQNTFSLMATLFIIVLVFFRLEVKSSKHLLAWRRCESAIHDIYKLIDDINSGSDEISLLIDSCYKKIEMPYN